MASKTINIDEKVYEKLKQMKGDKSFTEIILELMERANTTPWESFGVLSSDDLDYDEIKSQRSDRDFTF
jgi:predicted CopG family antitoxin